MPCSKVMLWNGAGCLPILSGWCTLSPTQYYERAIVTPVRGGRQDEMTFAALRQKQRRIETVKS
jgi:hypothetical protein